MYHASTAGGLDFEDVQFTVRMSPGLYSDFSLVTRGPSDGRTVLRRRCKRGEKRRENVHKNQHSSLTDLNRICIRNEVTLRLQVEKEGAPCRS